MVPHSSNAPTCPKCTLFSRGWRGSKDGSSNSILADCPIQHRPSKRALLSRQEPQQLITIEGVQGTAPKCRPASEERAGGGVQFLSATSPFDKNRVRGGIINAGIGVRCFQPSIMMAASCCSRSEWSGPEGATDRFSPSGRRGVFHSSCQPSKTPFMTALPFWRRITWNKSRIRHVSVHCSGKFFYAACFPH